MTGVARAVDAAVAGPAGGVQQLWRRLGLTSSNSGKLPSSDGPAQRCPARARGHDAAPDRVQVPWRRLAVAAVSLQNSQCLPEEQLTELLPDLFGVTLCLGMLANMRRLALWCRAGRRAMGGLLRSEALGRDRLAGGWTGTVAAWTEHAAIDLVLNQRSAEKCVAGTARDLDAPSLASLL